MTRSQADALLAEKDLHLVPIYHEDDLTHPHHYLVTTRTGHALGEGRTWQAAYATATQEAPF